MSEEKVITVKKATDFSHQEMVTFCENFRGSHYEIVISNPDADGMPESLIDCFGNKETYVNILDDIEAEFKNYAISIQVSDNKKIILPIGVFGESDSQCIRFPFILNGLWLMLLMANKAQFSLASGIFDGAELDFYFQKLADIRSSFIEKLFLFYKSLNGVNVSAMGWGIRNNSSLTRRLAEAVGFLRKEMAEQEIYVSSPVPSEKVDYLYLCVCRWIDTVDNVIDKDKNLNENGLALSRFARGLVGYENSLVSD